MIRFGLENFRNENKIILPRDRKIMWNKIWVIKDNEKKLSLSNVSLFVVDGEKGITLSGFNHKKPGYVGNSAYLFNRNFIKENDRY